jgi:hypothetical protein
MDKDNDNNKEEIPIRNEEQLQDILINNKGGGHFTFDITKVDPNKLEYMIKYLKSNINNIDERDRVEYIKMIGMFENYNKNQ